MATKEPVYYLKFMLPGRVTPFARQNPDKKQRTFELDLTQRFILPVDKWLPRRVPLPCVSGYHFCRNIWDLPDWWQSGELWLVQIRGKRVDDRNKACAAQMKLIKQIDITGDELASLYRDALNFKSMANNRRYRYQWKCDEKGIRLDIQNQGPPFKHLNRTKFVSQLNKILARNAIEKWGDPV